MKKNPEEIGNTYQIAILPIFLYLFLSHSIISVPSASRDLFPYGSAYPRSSCDRPPEHVGHDAAARGDNTQEAHVHAAQGRGQVGDAIANG